MMRVRKPVKLSPLARSKLVGSSDFGPRAFPRGRTRLHLPLALRCGEGRVMKKVADGLHLDQGLAQSVKADGVPLAGREFLQQRAERGFDRGPRLPRLGRELVHGGVKRSLELLDQLGDFLLVHGN